MHADKKNVAQILLLQLSFLMLACGSNGPKLFRPDNKKTDAKEDARAAKQAEKMGEDAEGNSKTAPIYPGIPDPNQFACLASASSVEEVIGEKITTKYEADSAKNKAFDARKASFFIESVRHGMIAVKGSDAEMGMCWVGGFVQSNKAIDATWADFKDPDGPTRNSTAIDNRAPKTTITGVHVYNVGDAFRNNNGTGWTVQHVWAEYVRDDCIENDQLFSGLVYDSLFDGCYSGISVRPSDSDPVDGKSNVYTYDSVLMRLEASPYPYKWESKSDVIGVDGKLYTGNGVPYGHGNLFKYDDDNPARMGHFVLKNSVFLLQHVNIDHKKLSFPPEALIDACENVTVIWMGPGTFPGTLPKGKFPDCVKILEGQVGLDFWREKVIDWHSRHPEVGAKRKPINPGDISFPRVSLDDFK